jgi:hypothetical protein
LRATIRSRIGSRARYTVPMAPWPRVARTSNLPIFCASFSLAWGMLAPMIAAIRRFLGRL